MHGRRAGLLVTLGLCSGLAVHTAAVALGVAAVFQGAAYLLYLAWGAFRAGAKHVSDQATPVPGNRALYLRGIVMTVTHPKVAIFFLAFLPRFADPARGSVTAQAMLCGLLFSVSALAVFSGIALGGRVVGGCLRGTPRAHHRWRGSV